MDVYVLVLVLALVLGVLLGAFISWQVGAKQKEKELKDAYVLLPKKGMWAEFSVSVDELATLYNMEQLTKLYNELYRQWELGDRSVLLAHIRNARDLRRARDVIAEMDISKQ